MARVFISHSSADAVLAGHVRRWLVEDGHDVFLDHDPHDGIKIGEDWQQRLHERLRWADAVVCLLTSAYVNSTWCTAEVSIAQSRGSRMLPIRAEPDVSHPLLKAVQHLDLTGGAVATRARLAAALWRVDAVGGAGWPDDRSPFPGLRPFDADLHRVFFGRVQEVEQLAALLRSPAERAERAALLVVGPSGCGKSSLVRAGLLPVMAGEVGWQTVPAILPGPDPVAALTRELTRVAHQLGLDFSTAKVRQRVADGGLAELANDLLLAGPAPVRTHLLIVVDQFEELLTQTAPAKRAGFADLLGPALAGPVRIVGTLRPEFLDQLLLCPELAGLPKRVHALEPLRREALRTVIEGPAQLAGIDVDDDLVDRLVADTNTGEALPLLAYTLAQLTEGLGRGGRLSASRYAQLGGVQGTLARQADAALAEATAASGQRREQVMKELLRLVTVDEQGRPTRWRIRHDELPAPVRVELDSFVTRRLLTTDIDNGQVVIGVAHEAFLSAWPPLAEAITAASTALRVRRHIEQAAADWVKDDQQPERLWERGQLAAALAETGARFDTPTKNPDVEVGGSLRSTWWTRRRHALVTDRVELSPPARQFLHASIHHDRTRRRRSTIVLATLLVLALIGAGIAVVQLGVTEQQRRLATKQQRIATARYLTTRAEAAIASDPRTALRLAEAAEHLNPAPETHAVLTRLLRDTRYAGTLTGPSNVAVAPNGRTAATSGEQTLLWDLSDPARPTRIGRPLPGHTGDASPVFGPDGHTLATVSGPGELSLWDLSDPARPELIGQPLSTPTGVVYSIAFAPDGRTLAAAGGSETFLWNLSNPARPQQIGPLTGHRRIVSSVAFAPDGLTLATVSDGDELILWDLSDSVRPHPIGNPITDYGGGIAELAFSPNGRILALDLSQETLLWDLSDRTRPQRIGEPLAGHTAMGWAVAFAPDGRTLATGGGDQTLLWDLSDPSRPQRIGQPLVSHPNSVQSVAFALNGRTLVTGGDQSTILWELGDPPPPQPIGQPLAHTLMSDVAFSPDGHTLVTAGVEDSGSNVVLWDLSDLARPHRIGQALIDSRGTGSTGRVRLFVAPKVTVSPDGRTLATSGEQTLLWDVSDPSKPQRIGQPVTGDAAAFAPDGHILATSTNSRELILLDLSDSARPQPIGRPLTGFGSHVSSVVFAPNGRTLAAVSGYQTFLWNLSVLSRPQQIGPPFTGHTGSVSTVAFAPSGQALATAGSDGTIILWDVTDPTRPQEIGQPLSGHTADVSEVAFAADGRTLASASEDGTIILWDLTDPARPQRIGHPLTSPDFGHDVGLTLSPDGRTLATRTPGTIILWDLANLLFFRDHALQIACMRTNGAFDPAEWASLTNGLPYEDPCAAA